LSEIGATQNSTVVFPIPMDLMKPALEALGRAPSSPAQAPLPEANGEANGTLPAGAPRELSGGEQLHPAEPARARRPRARD